MAWTEAGSILEYPVSRLFARRQFERRHLVAQTQTLADGVAMMCKSQDAIYQTMLI
jgi:hypothetical protein